MSGFRSFAFIYVTPLHSRRVIHHEIIETTGMSTADEVARVRDRLKALEAKFPLAAHDIADMSYSSLDAIRRQHPDLVIPDLG